VFPWASDMPISLKGGDMVAIRTDGTLFSYLSSGTGLKGAKQVGSGWNIMRSVL